MNVNTIPLNNTSFFSMDQFNCICCIEMQTGFKYLLEWVFLLPHYYDIEILLPYSKKIFLYAIPVSNNMPVIVMGTV